jgi:hypothetical protein
VYLTRVVESALPGFGEDVSSTKVVLRTQEGARRFRELSRSLGRLPPVPSLFLNGKLLFETIPAQPELTQALRRHLDAIERDRV